MNYKQELNEYVTLLLSRKASDIHLLVDAKPMFRLNKELSPIIQKESLTPLDTEGFLNAMFEGGIKQVREKSLLLFSYQHRSDNEKDINFRVTAYIEKNNIAIAMRLIELKTKTIEELHLPPVLKSVMDSPSGLFLVVGPANSGKSTTLATMINYVNDNYRKHIITIEDPVEFIFKNNRSIISQREIPLDAPSFESALNGALRADADIIAVGETRDKETMATMITAAEVGHLALSTLHANSATSTVNRIIDSFSDTQQNQIANQLSASLLGVCSMKLLPSVAGGLVPAIELLFNNKAVSNLIRERKTESLKTVIQTGRDEGMITLEYSLAELVKQGMINLEVAQKYSDDSKLLSKYL